MRPSARIRNALLAGSAVGVLAILAPGSASAACHGSECTAHYKATITAKLTTTWDLPKQVHGGGNCFRTPYIVGSGKQTMTTSGSGLVQFKRPGRLTDITYLRGKRGKLGIGSGKISVAREATMIQGDDPGPCGTNGDPRLEGATGCGTKTVPSTFILNFKGSRAVSLDVLSSASYSGCPLYATGLTPFLTNLHGWSEHDFLKPQKAKISRSKLFSGRLKSVTLRGKQTFSRRGGYGYDVPPSSLTTVNWKVKLKRVHHADFSGV